MLEAAGIGNGGDLFVLKMGEAVRIVDLAKDLIRLSGFEPSDIPIKFTGIRPGEKLFELLWEPGASIEPTANNDIVRVVENPVAYDDLPRLVQALAVAAREGRKSDLLALIAGALPEFKAVSAVFGRS